MRLPVTRSVNLVVADAVRPLRVYAGDGEAARPGDLVVELPLYEPVGYDRGRTTAIGVDVTLELNADGHSAVAWECRLVRRSPGAEGAATTPALSGDGDSDDDDDDGAPSDRPSARGRDGKDGRPGAESDECAARRSALDGDATTDWTRGVRDKINRWVHVVRDGPVVRNLVVCSALVVGTIVVCGRIFKK